MNVSFVLVLGPAGGRWWLALSGGVEKFPPVFVHILGGFLGGAKGGGQPPCLFLPLLVFFSVRWVFSVYAWRLDSINLRTLARPGGDVAHYR
jgi:hypothetical protein